MRRLTGCEIFLTTLIMENLRLFEIVFDALGLRGE